MARRRRNKKYKYNPERNGKKGKGDLLTREEIRRRYSFSDEMIDEFLPPALCFGPFRKADGGVVKDWLWPESDVSRALSRKEVRAAREKAKAEHREEELRLIRATDEERREISELFRKFDLEYMLDIARSMVRHFTLHIGPTNSGKTYDAIKVLKESRSGVYLGPLRLLALEMYDRLNEAGCLCNLLTGEEYEFVPGAKHTASTIELCNFERDYETAVIDEAQMIADPMRGANWTHAILCVRAREIQVCMAPEAEWIVCKLLDMTGSDYDIVRHERLAPLEYAGSFKTIDNVEPGDALITFSRKNVLSTAAQLEQKGIKASVIYGALPPASRREEVRRFENKETEVVVATDAIGMGISLPIRRILFCTAWKFDGTENRILNAGEIKQIAGRAGRFGLYDIGYVLSNVSDRRAVQSAMSEEVPEIEKIIVPFPRDALSSPFNIPKLFDRWQHMKKSKFFRRADLSEAEELYRILTKRIENPEGLCGKELVYDLITCPVEIRNSTLVNYWFDCCKAIIKGKEVPLPRGGEDSLEECELKYKEYDVRHQLLRRIGIEEAHLDEKERLCDKINAFLLESKKEHLRYCRDCGKILPITASFNLCDSCSRKRKILNG